MRPEIFSVCISKYPRGTSEIRFAELYFTLFDLSQKECLLRILQNFGVHGFHDIAEELDSTFFDRKGYLYESSVEVLSRLGQDSFEKIEKTMRYWRRLEFSTEEEAAAWINSDACSSARRDSFASSLLLLPILPITEDGKIVMLRWPSSTRIFDDAKRSLIQGSEWRGQPFE